MNHVYTSSIIYGLFDPRDDKIKYIGYTSTTLALRLQNHYSEAFSLTSFRRNSFKNKWIRELKELGIRPLIKEIEKVDFSERKEKEIYWIKHYGRKNLFNETNGGDTCLGLFIFIRSTIQGKRDALIKTYKRQVIRAIRIYIISTTGIDPVENKEYKFKWYDLRTGKETRKMKYDEHVEKIMNEKKTKWEYMSDEEIEDRYNILTLENPLFVRYDDPLEKYKK